MEFPATREGLVPAVVDHIRHDQLEPHLARHVHGPARSVGRKVGPETLALPALVRGNHGEMQRRDAARAGRALGDRHEHVREAVLLPLPRAEAREVKALRSTGKDRPVMPGGIGRLDDDPVAGNAVPVTLHWRSGSGMREPNPRPPPGGGGLSSAFGNVRRSRSESDMA